MPPQRKVSAEAKDLIMRLITDPELRLGSNGGAEEIKQHPFFASIDWDEAENRRLPAPYKPEMRDDYGLSNFEDYEEDDEEDLRLQNGGGVRDLLARHPVNGRDDDRRRSKDYIGFYEFTFRRFFDHSGYPLPLRLGASTVEQQQESAAPQPQQPQPDAVFV